MHEGRPAHDELVHEYAQGVPIGSPSVACVHDDLGWDVLRCATKRVGPVPSFESFNKAKISQLEVPAVLQQDILRLQVSVDEVLSMHVLEHEHDLSRVKLDHLCVHAADLLQHIQ